MADIARLEQALRNADKAGDTNAARAFAAEIRKMRSAEVAPVKQSSPAAFDPSVMGSTMGGFQMIDDAVRGAANGLTFGLADRFAGVMGGEGTEAERAKSSAANERGNSYMVGEIGGAVAGLGKLQGAGITAGRFLPQGVGLLGKGAAGAADALAANEAMNAGYGRDFGENAGLAAGVGTAAPVLGRAVSSVASKALASKAPVGMDKEALKQAAQGAYKQADDAGVIYTPDALKRVSTGLRGEFADFGFHPELQSGAKVALGELDRLAAGNTTLKGLDTARKVAGNAFIPGNKSNNALTGKVTSAIDDLVQNPKAGDVLAGDATKAATSIKTAREMYGRSAKLDKLDELFERGELNASSSGSGGNLQNATRQQLKRILLNKGWDRGFSETEKAAIQKFVNGTGGQNILRSIGAMSPAGNGLGKMMWGGAATASALTNPATLIPMALGAAVTTASKKGAEAITRKNFAKLENLVASGGKAIPKNAKQKAIESKEAIIARLLAAGGLAGIGAN